jgi:hypothetical protein
MAAGLGFKDFVTGEVLTAADVDGYLMQGVWVFASAAARDAAVTSPQEGNFAYLKDTNVTTYYTGSAWANLDTTGMTNPMTTTGDTIYSSSGSTPARLGIGSTGQVLTVAAGIPSWSTPAGGGGLTLITPSSIANSGGTATLSGAVTTASSVNSVSFNGVFSSTYVNYLIVYNELIGSTTLQTQMRLRASGTDTSGTAYFMSGYRQAWGSGSSGGYGENGGNNWGVNIQTGNTYKDGSTINVFSPNVAVNTTFTTVFVGNESAGFNGGVHNSSTQFDGFTILPSTGSLSGIFRTYGISN